MARQVQTAPTRPLADLICLRCNRTYTPKMLAWRCDECQGVLDVANFPVFIDVEELMQHTASMWRYASTMPIELDVTVSLGEGMTPLIQAHERPNLRLKLDFLMPTLSFKDRGAVVLATLAKRLGIAEAMVDSSGNAGTAVAAYFARAGIPCTVYVPAGTSDGKLSQMRAHGATVVLVPGTRADTSRAAEGAAGEPGVMYASHVHNPYFLHGVKTYGYEIWEQSGFRLPETVVLPVGNGTMVLGCALAFNELVAAGLADRVPVIIGVQAQGCAPLEQAMYNGARGAVPVEAVGTIAEGIAIVAPPRGEQILAAIRASGGTIVAVTNDQTAAARADLARQGLFVEPTSAVCWAAVLAADDSGTPPRSTWAAALPHLRAEDVVVPLCGAGLKSPKESHVHR